MPKKKEFWVVNVSNKNVCLSDLALTIPAKRCYNLLDDKHFYYTEEQLDKSLKSGSLHKKRDKIRLAEDKPYYPNPPKREMSKQPAIRRPFSAVKTTTPQYDELVFSDEKYAEEISELFDDTGPFGVSDLDIDNLPDK